MYMLCKDATGFALCTFQNYFILTLLTGHELRLDAEIKPILKHRALILYWQKFITYSQFFQTCLPGRLRYKQRLPSVTPWKIPLWWLCLDKYVISCPCLRCLPSNLLSLQLITCSSAPCEFNISVWAFAVHSVKPHIHIALTYSCGSIKLLQNGILEVLLTSFPHFPQQGFHFCQLPMATIAKATSAIPSLMTLLFHFSDEHWKC